MKVLTVTNQKGGVGKTALACHLAFAGRDAGQRVLVIDLDTQANASTTLTMSPPIPEAAGGAAALFEGEPLEPLATPVGIDLLFGHQRLDALDARFTLESAGPVGERIRALEYDLVVIDTPPAIGLRHVGPMLWCDDCLIPLEPNGYSVLGLSQTLATLALAKRLNPSLASHAIINRYVLRSKQQGFYLGQIAARLPLSRPYLVLRVAVADALDAGVPVWKFPRATPDTRDQWKRLCGGFVGAIDA